MSEPDLEAIRARKDAATPGPWDAPLLGGVWTDDDGGGWITTDAEDANAEFIAHARTDIPDLLEAIDRLRSMLIDAETEAQMQAAEVERLRAIIDKQYGEDVGVHP